MTKTKILFVSLVVLYLEMVASYGGNDYLVVLYLEMVASCGGKGNHWDRLVVHFPMFTILPQSEDQALAEGWMNDASCDTDSPFYGNRYVKGNDTSTRILFDNDGKLVGIQGTITESDDLILSPTRPRPAAFVKDDHGHYLLTAYFTKKPKDICKKQRHRRDDKDDGKRHKKAEDALVIQMSDVRLCKPRFMEIPLNERELAKTSWVKGRCYPNMGVHYWYDISLDMHCDQLLPVFLLYDQASQRLKSFGWAVAADIKGPLWEHPPPSSSSLQIFFQEVPKCLLNQKMLSTQHIYLTDPLKLTCSA